MLKHLRTEKKGQQVFRVAPLDLDAFQPLRRFPHNVFQGFKLLESELRATLKHGV